MNLILLLATMLIAMINISIPSVFSEMKVFAPQDQDDVSITYFVEVNEDSNDGEKEDDLVEVEEAESAYFTFSHFNGLNYSIQTLNVHGPLKTYISSYFFSIFIPPSL